MATQETVQTITREAGADLSAGQYKFVDIASDGQVDLSGAGLNSIGVLLNKPDAAGTAATIAISGVAKVEAGATVAAGALVQSDANGDAITASTSDFVVGRALTGGDDGELIEVLLGSNHLNIA